MHILADRIFWLTMFYTISSIWHISFHHIHPTGVLYMAVFHSIFLHNLKGIYRGIKPIAIDDSIFCKVGWVVFDYKFNYLHMYLLFNAGYEHMNSVLRWKNSDLYKSKRKQGSYKHYGFLYI